MFTQSQQQALAAPLERANVQTRSQSNRGRAGTSLETEKIWDKYSVSNEFSH